MGGRGARSRGWSLSGHPVFAFTGAKRTALTANGAAQRFLKDRLGEMGVEPDVKVKAADALQTTEKLAERKLERK